MSDDRDPTDELLERARSVLDRRRATVRLLEERHRNREEPGDEQGESGTSEGDPTSLSDAFRDRLRRRLDARGFELDADGNVRPRGPGGDAA